MGKLKKQRFTVYERDARGNYLYDNKAIDFECDINVNVDGHFTLTLPEDVVIKYEEGTGNRLWTNGRMNAKRGYFENSSLEKLLKNVTETLEELVSKTLIEDKIVIRYQIETTCRYGIKGKDLTPYKAYLYGDEAIGYEEKQGNNEIHSSNPNPFGFRVFTHVVHKRTYRYKTGTERVFMESVSTNGLDMDEFPMLHYLASIHCQKPCKIPIQELEYTEERAEFFVDLYKTIFRINEKIKEYVSPESILEIIANKQGLLS